MALRIASLPRSAWAVLAAALVPLLGVLALGWDLGAVMLLFWTENLVVGAFHVLRLALVTGRLAWFAVPFFTLHFGAFTLVHGLFVVGFFVLDRFTGEADLSALLFVVVPGTLALVASHGWSYYANFLRGGERARMRTAIATLSFRKTAPRTWTVDAPVQGADVVPPGFHELGALMTVPYRRVVVLHVVILFGGILLTFLGTPLPALLLLVVLKAAVDLRAHLAERARLRAPIDAPAASEKAGVVEPPA